MKKFLSIFAMAMLLMMQGCSTNDLDEIPSPEVNLSHKVQIAGDIDQQSAARVDQNGFCSGDQVGIYLVNYDGETPGVLGLEDNQADNVKFTYLEDGSWVSE